MTAAGRKTAAAAVPLRPIGKILVANRGEIAVRVIRACRELGLASVAVCSEADQNSLHVELSDEHVVIGPAEPTASYLRVDRLVAAAVDTGADAVHPGYGFLAENADFARACGEAGLVFIGPSPDVISRMGEKTAARQTMSAAGVPVVPGATLPPAAADGSFDGPAVHAACAGIGFPVLVKAAFGGGGKGMRLVTDEAQVVAACEGAAREARGAFGDGTVYLEKYVEQPRHVEFQIFGDQHGNQVHLFERECSIQRRHQKIIEESPSPAVTPELRTRMGEAAVAAARAVGYTGAGTVEFLVDAAGGFYFLEMNTRLQVEHPVTELITGTDLVRAQVAVAEGRPLPWTQADLSTRGHAIECRIYAEDAAGGFLPSLGPLLLYREPTGPGVRVDSGVRQGDEVSLHYDPMLAKLIVHGPDRNAAVARAVTALRAYPVLGVTTNIPYLIDVLLHPEFAAGRTHTGFLEAHFADWRGFAPDDLKLALQVAAVAEHERRPEPNPNRADEGPATATNPWQSLGRFRLQGLD